MTAAPEPSPKRRYVDTKTRYEGVYARHQLCCAKAVDKSKRCTCTPSYYGKVWDPAIGRHRLTERRPAVAETKNLRDDLLGRVLGGAAVERPKGIRFDLAHTEFIAACRAGVALNKHGKRYSPKAITNLDSSLNRLPKPIRQKLLGSVTGADLQAAVDGYQRQKLSSSRISNIISSARALYSWGRKRGKVNEDPTVDVQTPVVETPERDRIAKPWEFAVLLDQLDPQDALPWALAAYGTARLQEIQILEWPEVDFANDTMLLAESEEARKSEAAWRIVPLAAPLRERLHAEWVRQEKPKSGRVCPPRRRSNSGLISLNQLSKKIIETWKELGFLPIGLQDSRHTAATWLDHAGVPPKVASVLMGHAAPNRRRHPQHYGAAPITQRRYTHVLDGELERARVRLDTFLAEREAEERPSEKWTIVA